MIGRSVKYRVAGHRPRTDMSYFSAVFAGILTPVRNRVPFEEVFFLVGEDIRCGASGDV